MRASVVWTLRTHERGHCAHTKEDTVCAHAPSFSQRIDRGAQLSLTKMAPLGLALLGLLMTAQLHAADGAISSEHLAHHAAAAHGERHAWRRRLGAAAAGAADDYDDADRAIARQLPVQQIVKEPPPTDPELRTPQACGVIRAMQARRRAMSRVSCTPGTTCGLQHNTHDHHHFGAQVCAQGANVSELLQGAGVGSVGEQQSSFAKPWGAAATSTTLWPPPLGERLLLLEAAGGVVCWALELYQSRDGHLLVGGDLHEVMVRCSASLIAAWQAVLAPAWCGVVQRRVAEEQPGSGRIPCFDRSGQEGGPHSRACSRALRRPPLLYCGSAAHPWVRFRPGPEGAGAPQSPAARPAGSALHCCSAALLRRTHGPEGGGAPQSRARSRALRRTSSLESRPPSRALLHTLLCDALHFCCVCASRINRTGHRPRHAVLPCCGAPIDQRGGVR